MRTFNLRLVLWLAGIFLVVAVAVHFLHGRQVRKNAGAYLILATEKDAAVRDENLKPADRTKAAEAATQHYRRYLALDPHDVKARADFGKLLVYMGDLGKAYFQFERVLRASPKDPEDSVEVQSLQKLQDEIRRLQVDVAINVQRIPDAIVHLDALLASTDNKDSALLERLGYCQAVSGNYVAALKSLDKAIENSPDRLTAYWMKVQLQRDRLLEPDLAKATIAQMVAANPQNADAYLVRAQFLLNDKDPATQAQRLVEATTACETLLKLQPDHADGLALAAMCAQQRALENKEPENATEELKAAEGLRKAEELSKAREYLRKSIGIKPDVPQRYLQWANVELLAHAGDRAKADAEAIKVIRDGITAIPDNARNFDLRWRLADLLISSSQKDEAKVKEVRELQAEMKKEKPDSPLIVYLAARQLYMDEKWFETQQILENARGGLSQWPDLRTRADEMLGRCYAQLGDNDLRLSAFRRVLDENQLDIAARRNYADALISVGRLPEAMREYDQIFSTLGSKWTLDLFKRYYFLKFVSTSRQPRVERNWEPLKAMLDNLKAPNDPWVPIKRAELALVEEKDAASRTASENAERKKVEETPEGAKVAQDAPRTAKDILAKARADMRNELSVWMVSIELAQRQGSSEEVAQLLAEIEKNFGDTVDVRMAKARVLISQKGKEGLPELAAFTQNLDKIPDTSEQLQLYWQLASLCSSVQEPAQGLVYGRQAAHLAPNNLQIRMALLRMARSAKDVPTAEQLAAEIKQIAQSGAVTLYAQSLFDLTRYAANNQDTAALQAARDKLLQAAGKRPTWEQVPLLLGEIAELEKNESAVLTHYTRAVDLGNRNPAVISRVARLLLQRGRTDEADQVIRKLEEQAEAESLDVAWLASRISATREDYERALEKAEIPIAAGSKKSADYLWVGQLLRVQRQWPQAQESIQKAITLDPKDDAAYLAMVRLLVAEARELGNAGKGDDAQLKLAQAEKELEKAQESVADDKRAPMVAQCRELLGQIDEAVKQFDEAIKQNQDDPGLLEAAVRFYVRYPVLWQKAKPILERFVKGELTKTEDLATVPWARRELAQILRQSGNYQDFLRAMTLSDANLQASPNSADDLELRARLLVSRQLRSLQKEAVKVLERRAELPEPVGLETQFLQAQLHLALGDWVKGSQLMAAVVTAARERAQKTGDTSSDATGDLAAYLNAYINALLDHDEVTEAEVWIGVWRRTNPKELRVAMLAARTLVPKRPVGQRDAAPTLRVKDAIEVLNKAVEDPEVLPEDKTTKMAIAVLVMEDLFDVVLKDGTTEDADLLKTTIADYYQKIIDSDPALKASRQLIQVQFLVRQGERRRAIDLVNQYWGDAPVETLITACGALLNVDDNLKNAEKLELAQQFTEADKEKRKAQLMAEVGEVEAVVQQALLKYQTELATLEGPENATKKKIKEAEVVSLMSLLANQYVNTKRYSEAVGTYTDILSRQPGNVIALNNRAMIMAGGLEKLDEALSQINEALNIVGPLPMIVDSQAMVLLAAGKAQEALEAAKRVMLEKPDRLDPESDKQLAKQWGGYSFHLALISDANGDAAGAAIAMQEADKLGFKEADVFDLELPAWKKLAAKLGM